MINGTWFDGTGLPARAARLHIAGATLFVVADGRPVTTSLPMSRVEVSARLADTPRRLRFPEGGWFETEDHEAVDRLLAARRKAGRLDAPSPWPLVAGALALGLLAAIWAVVAYGIPALARVAARAVPASLSASLDTQLVERLDRQLLEPTRLDETIRQRLRERLLAFRPGAGQDLELKVLFRSAEKTIGPNAMALPGGTIVVTDELVKLAQNDNQLLAVYAHEAGHVAHRHALRQTIQASFLSLLAVAIAGDLSSVSSLITTLPVTLTQLGYSRDFEREADLAAVKNLRAAGLDPEDYAKMLERLEAWQRCELPRDSGAPPCKPPQGEGLFTSYLSTHPPTSERVALVREATRK